MQNLSVPSIIAWVQARRLSAWPLVICLLPLLTPGRAQEYYFKQYEVTDGLSHNTIHCATQDDEGFMWFGTKNGLNRFDGYEFKWYQSDEDRPGSLGSNFIECIDFSDGLLWVGTDNGLFSGDPGSGRFTLVANTADRPILDVAHDLGGNLWYVTDNTLYRQPKSNGEPLRSYENPGRQPARGIAVSKQDRICLVTDTGLFLYESSQDTFLPLHLDLAADDFPLSISSVYWLNETSLAVGTISHGLFIYDIPNRNATPVLDHLDRRLYVRDFLLRGNDLWIGTEDGVYVYNLFSRASRHLEKETNRPYAISDNAIYCLYEDTHGGVWIGSYFRGLNYYSEALSGFRKYVPLARDNSVNGMAIREMKQDRYGKLWIGTEDAGLDRYDPATNQFLHFPLRTADGQALATNVHGLLLKEDELWVGTFQNGLFVLDPETGAVKDHRVAGPKSGLRSNFVYTLYMAGDGSVFATTSSGVHRYLEDSAKFTVFPGFPANYFYTSFYEDDAGGLWAGTYWDGLFYHDPSTGESRSYATGSKEAFRISNDAINGIFADSRKNIWVATENGLNRIAAGRGEITRYGQKDGFPSNVFYAVLEDQDGKLWISTANGMVCFDPTSNRIDRYTTENGLVSNQFNYNSALIDRAGRMYFGGVKGFISFDPADPRFNLGGPTETIVLTDFSLNVNPANGERSLDLHTGRPENDKGAASVNLKYDQSTFTVSYSALDFDTPGLTEYSYELAGLSNGWIKVGNTHRLFFTDLQAGEYILNVKARIHNGDWSAPVTLLSIVIAPPWYASTPAYLLYFVLALIATLLMLRFYHSYTQAKTLEKMRQFDNEKEKEVYRAKIEFFTNISHEILTPLTLIKNPIEKLLGGAGEGTPLRANLSLIHRNTVRLINLVQQLLDFRKTEMEHATLSFVRADVNRLLLDTVERFSSAAEEAGIVVTHDLGVGRVYAHIDVEAFKKIISNLYQNALKYGEHQIALGLSTTDVELMVRVTNDGILIPPAEREKIFQPFYRLPAHGARPGTGLGLSLAYSLAELHDGRLRLEEEETTINTFILSLPLFQQAGAAPTATAERETGNGSAGATLLVVEDNSDLLDFVATDLSEIHSVIRASSGEEAIALLHTRRVQLVISDVMMPGVSGYALCRQIRSDPSLSHVPVILLTARTSLNSEIEGLEAGADAYVTKPFSMDYLKTRISNLLVNRRHIVEHFSSTPLAHIKSIAQSPADDNFIGKLDDLILEAITDPDLSVEYLAERMHMSRSTLYRKIKDLTSYSPNELINLTRLKKAAELLKRKQYKVYEIAEMVGYRSASSFGRSFQKQFKMSPSEYANVIAPASPRP